MKKNNLSVGFAPISVKIEGSAKLSGDKEHVIVLSKCDDYEAVLIAQKFLDTMFGDRHYYAAGISEKTPVLVSRKMYYVNFLQI